MKKVERIKQNINEAGFKLNVLHYRKLFNTLTKRTTGFVTMYEASRLMLNNPNLVFSAKGGKTSVEVWDEKNYVLATGEAFCSSCDNFCKKIGYHIALGRVMKQELTPDGCHYESLESVIQNVIEHKKTTK